MDLIQEYLELTKIVFTIFFQHTLAHRHLHRFRKLQDIQKKRIASPVHAYHRIDMIEQTQRSKAGSRVITALVLKQ